MRVFGRLLLLLALIMASGGGLRGQIIEYPNPGMQWYGNSVGVNVWFLNFGIMIPGTLPIHHENDFWPTPAPSPPGFYLSDTAAWNNMVQYSKAVGWGNATRLMNLTALKTRNTKDGTDPLVGQGPSSLSFWQWIKLGESTARTYSHLRSIMRALQAGRLDINLWKLAPKIAFTNEAAAEGEQGGSAIFLALQPTNQNSLHQAMSIRWANSLSTSQVTWNLKDLAPSLAVKPSLFGLVAHDGNTDMTMAAQVSKASRLPQSVHSNFHEIQVLLSAIRRNVAGAGGQQDEFAPTGDAVNWDNARRRYSPGMQSIMANRVQNARRAYWDNAYQEIQRGLVLVDSNAAASFQSMQGAFQDMRRAEENTLGNAAERRAGNWWQAKALNATLSNIVMPLETEDYLNQVNLVEELVKDYASAEGITKRIPIAGDESDPPLTEPLHQEEDDSKITLGIAVADAWTNRLVRDELRAIRQIFSTGAQVYGNQRMAPYIAKTFGMLQYGAKQLTQLQQELQMARNSKATVKAKVKPAAFNKFVTKMDTPNP